MRRCVAPRYNLSSLCEGQKKPEPHKEVAEPIEVRLWICHESGTEAHTSLFTDDSELRNEEAYEADQDDAKCPRPHDYLVGNVPSGGFHGKGDRNHDRHPDDHFRGLAQLVLLQEL